MIVFGLAGKAGVGKDTVADYLVRYYGFQRRSFAGPIKAMLAAIGVTDARETKELPHPVFGVSPRYMMQTLGTEWMRNMVCEDGWLRLANVDLSAAAHLDNSVRFVFTDARFENEARLIHNYGGSVIEVLRPSVTAVAAHVSEAGIPLGLIDGYLYNGTTFDRLYGAVDFLMWKHGIRFHPDTPVILGGD